VSRRGGRTRGDGAGADRRLVLGFIVRLLVGWAIATVVLALVPAIERAMVEWTVASVAATIRVLGMRTAIAGDVINVGATGLHIIPECTPLMPFLLFGIAILAYPGAGRDKLAGLAAGAVALWAFNVLRMLALLATLMRWPHAFRFVHVYLWQTVTLLAVTAMFLLWLRLTGRRPAAAAVRAA
jgi:exosortase/archaeosortase family protein